MAELLNMIDGHTKIVFSTLDFIELVDRYMGYDAQLYIEEQLEKIEKLEEEIEEYRSSAERTAEAHDLMLSNIILDLEAVAKMIDRPRMDKKKVLQSLSDLTGFINNMR